MNISLSGNQILNALNGKSQILDYKNILKKKNIDDLLGIYKNAVIIYLTKENYGHWTCIFKNGNTIHFFDSYGTKPDNQFKNIPDYINKNSHQTYKYLTELLYECPYEVRFNQYRLQKHGENISTCGRWVIERLKNTNLDENEFADIFLKSGVNPDLLVTMLTKDATENEKIGGKINNIIEKLELIDNPDPKSNKRAIAIFTLNNAKIKKIKFGLKNSKGTYYDGAPNKKRQAYIARHSKMGENWNNDGIMSPGWLSRWVLWEKRANETLNFLKKKTKINNLSISINSYND